jgi:MFS family permease
MSSNASFYAVNVDIAKDRAATSMGIMSICFSLSSIIAPTLSGFIVAWTGGFDQVFHFMMILGLLSALNMLLFHNHQNLAIGRNTK